MTTPSQPPTDPPGGQSSLLLRIYTDTSVIGGCFDEQFAEYSNQFMAHVREGRFRLLISDVVARELQAAPPNVQHVLNQFSPDQVESLMIDDRTFDLVDAYLAANILGPRSVDDATHVAAAALAHADAIVSWNFKHIVRLDKIKAYNQVNRKYGLPSLTIVTPIEVVHVNSD